MRDDLAQQYIKHLESILECYNSSPKPMGYLEDRTAHGLIARSRSAVTKISGQGSSYALQIEQILSLDAVEAYKAEAITGVIEALKGDLGDGYLGSLEQLVHGEIFNDFLHMAEFLLQQGYKDASAVIIGGTLEAHLRRLCIKNGISVEQLRGSKSAPKPASLMNQELGNNVYSLFDQKLVTAWLDLRNSAAHGQYASYTADQVELFAEGMKDFIARNPT